MSSKRSETSALGIIEALNTIMKFVFEVSIAIRAEHVAHVPGDSEGVPKTLSDVPGGSEDVPNMSSAKEDH
ncbi:unnamed protein product [Heligmosomoides polygyrus]|uniref:Uncharacterized protein n=1 Tax=Heligmosomoides polygyrus TaxID=6339 RepID=A0A183G693_HELPZ|nr:unnamed protein product [Heligmosomoides polygyrus]